MKYILILFLIASCEDRCAQPISEIVSVGGCDRYGRCGVMLKNGHKTASYYPVIGQELSEQGKCE